MQDVKKDMSDEFVEAYDTLIGAEGDAKENECPVCGSSRIEFNGTWDGDKETVYLPYRCRDCGSEYDLVYQFSGAYVHRDGRFPKYQCVANLCDGKDYVRTWEGGWYGSVQEAEDAPLPYPSLEEVRRIAQEYSEDFGTPLEEFDLQVGIYDEKGNEQAFYTDGIV